jgi:tyrosine-protein kinase Etk/Wzc
MQQKPGTSLKDIDLEYYFTRYINLIWRWKWYIILSGPIIILAWSIYFLKFGTVKQELDATAIIALENAQDMSAVREMGRTPESGVELIKSRNFMTSIVNKLSLRFVLSEFQRNEIFDSVKVDSTAIPGVYFFEVDEDKRNYQLFFLNSGFGPEKRLIESGELIKLSSILRNGVYVQFTERFLKDPKNFNYAILKMRAAVDRLRKSILIQSGTLSSGSMYCNIISKGKDYPLITKIANVIANEFVDISNGSKRKRAKEFIDVLEKQLETANGQLRAAQDSVDNFRRRYPSVGLGADMMNNVSNLALLESGSVNNKSWADEAQRLRTRLATATDMDRVLYINEALIFLSSRGNTAAAVLQQEFSQLSARQQQLTAGYDRSHPYVIENLNKIAEVRAKTDALLSEFASSATNSAQTQINQLQDLTNRLHGLPVLQTKLAELERQLQVTSQIHSTILSRYNQAKISDAVKVEGIYVMDYAIEPEPFSDFMNTLIKLGIGFLIGLMVSVGPPILWDFLDKTARTENDLSKMLDITVLESMPEIIDPKLKKQKKKEPRKKGTSPKARKIEDKLITADYSPNYANEIFRSLRAKIMLRMHDIEKKCIIISSYGVSEGKSLMVSNIAITMAQQQLRTVLIDGDIRRGVIHNSFVLNKKPGLSNFLFSEEPVSADSVKALLQPAHVPNLSIISSGANVPNPSELLSLPRFSTLIETLKLFFDVIIFDTPPLSVAADAAIVSNLFNANILIVKAGYTNVINLRKKLKEYPTFKKKVIGVVLNYALLDRKLKEYKYSAYHY